MKSTLLSNTTTVVEIDPLGDGRWDRLVERHAGGSVFQTSGWLRALERTYGYTPGALTTSAEGSELANAVVFCDVRSWLTGRRFVSLPFSDYCDPLVESEEELGALMNELLRRAEAGGCRYSELRPRQGWEGKLPEFRTGRRYVHHRLDLRPGGGALYGRLHHDCIQRKLRRAEKEGLVLSRGLGAAALADFYRLVVQTRRRQGLPPQPSMWFRNIAECLADSAVLRLAYKDNQAIAGILTLRHRKSLYYKYGASDARFHKLGGIPFLIWDAIQDGIAHGFEELDLGRSDATDIGLLTFKDRWGAERSELSYYNSPGRGLDAVPDSLHRQRMIRWTLQHLPAGCLRALGRAFYAHIG